MLVYLFTKDLQEDLFMKFHKLIMWRKHINTLHIGLHPTKYFAGNVDEVNPRKKGK